MKLTISIITVLGALSLILFYFIYLSLPKATYKLNKLPVLLTKEVERGDQVRWISDVCKLHNKDYRTERVLRNLDSRREFPLEISISKLPPLKKGECRASEASQLIPANQPPGKYELITRVFVKSNKYSINKFEYTVGEFTIK